MGTARSKGIGGTVVAAAVIVVVLAVAAGYYLLVLPGSNHSTTPPATIQMSPVSIASGTGSNQALSFNPRTITVVVGVNNTILFTNNDGVEHTVTFTSGPSGVTSAQLNGLSISNLAAGSSGSITLTTPGTYQYHCTIHSWMTGTINVLAA